MTLKLGSDIVNIPKFEKTLRGNKEYFAQNVFWPEELDYARTERLAGIFATKEAVIKALGMKAGQWREIRVAYEESGKPYLAKFPQTGGILGKLKAELTIAHDGDYAIANVIFYN